MAMNVGQLLSQMKRLEAKEIGSYGIMLRMLWTERVSNVEVLSKMKTNMMLILKTSKRKDDLENLTLTRHIARNWETE